MEQFGSGAYEWNQHGHFDIFAPAEFQSFLVEDFEIVCFCLKEKKSCRGGGNHSGKKILFHGRYNDTYGIRTRAGKHPTA